HRPENAAFEFERGKHRLLLLRCPRIALDEIEREVGVALRLRRTLVEIAECLASNEIVVRKHARHALADNHRRKQLGERGGDRLEQGLLAHEMHVGLDGKTRARQDSAQGRDVTALKPEAVGELEPPRNAAVAFALAIMVDETRAPFAAHGEILATRDQARVLDGNHRLVIVAIESPGLHLTFAALAAVQQCMERMQAMVAFGADIAQRGFKFVRWKQLHRTISIPSSAACHPASSAVRRSTEPSIRIGLVLLICTKMRRANNPANARRDTPVTSICRWPMRRPVFCPVCVRIISSSVNSVPSNSTTSARAKRSRIAGVTAAVPGTKTMRAPSRCNSIPTLAALSISSSGASPSR